MAATFTPEYDVTEIEAIEPSGRRRKITKFALAGVAVLGVGAALTSAAWTDNVWFGGNAESTGIDLVGSVDGGTTWDDGTDNGDGSYTLEMGTIYVGPEETSTDSVLLRNDSDVPVRLSAVDVNGDGGVFENLLAGNTTGAATVAANGVDTVLQPGQDVVITVSVTGGDWNDGEYQNITGGRITLQVEGTTDL